MAHDDTTSIEYARRLADAEHRALKTLGLEPGASSEAVRRAYRILAIRHHPDVNGRDSEASERFRQICNACAFLSGRLKDPDAVAAAPETRITDPARSGRYRTDNPWGMFLWWRERFF